ncbi:MAG: prepilin-type N-terminal cleavage/methylation domain-containing protein [Gemmatimonadota bacterium]|nr:prepilin-type N-terminal cleavage/methylation domain-containing protein [Gemmatimonadota bacterium]
MRTGFTIVELLITLVILSAGLLALHGSSALTLRMVGGGWTRTVAASVAQRRLELLRSSACAGLASGSDETRAVRERWTVSPTSGGVGIELTVEYLVRVPRGATSERSATFRAVVPCA